MWRDGIEARTFFVGVDLGQRRDHSGIVVVERRRTVFGPPSQWDYSRQRVTRLGVRHVERVPLDTPYEDVVARVGRMVRSGELAGNCRVAVDATGVGMPVVEMMRRSHYTCPIDPVVITGGHQGRQQNGLWLLPKVELVTRVRVLLEGRKLQVGRKVPGAELLMRELEGMRVKVNGPGREVMEAGDRNGHDDLVIALALACWAGCVGGAVGPEVDLGIGRPAVEHVLVR